MIIPLMTCVACGVWCAGGAFGMIGFLSKYTDLLLNGRFQRTQQDQFLYMLDKRDIRLKEQFNAKYILNSKADATIAYDAATAQKH